MSEKLTNLETAIDNIKNNKNKYIFLVPDSNGVARASIATIYQQAMIMKKNGFNVIILHEKNDYMKASAWLGDEYDELEHISIESNSLEVGAADFLILPEIFGNVIEKIEHIPCHKIVFVQSLEHMLDSYSPGKSWLDYGILDTITTSKESKDVIEKLMYTQNVKVIPPMVSEEFKPYDKIKKPVVAIHCKEPRKTARLLKMFYIKYPYLRWVVFRDMHGMTYNDFARNLSECIVSVWSDSTSTFPLFLAESLKCDVPVIGQIPQHILLDWMTDECATWAMTDYQIIELVAVFVKSWLEDNVPQEFKDVKRFMEDKFTYEQMKETVLNVYKEYSEERLNTLTKMIEKIKEIENNTETPENNEENN